ncbi:prolyl oligopeptidase family serine peptidase [Flavobacterium sp. NST-5]|uniref:Prolyl oligopeptidase family serine peptidase n=1 Tax=Flavobacterium ichthyis TaxID=2698827 RepID=A0ABW9Z519_9FLAO|nr:S9 family peptidase [Flavobacterium ichthyis]NBL63938.1 prolyl oligopeptidase family serine peptidase [Flavobacterium ichthyis]
MKKIVFLSAFLFVGISGFAQKNLTIEEATFGQYRNFAVENMVAPQWRKDTKTLTYLDNSYQNLSAKSAENNWSETVLVSKTELENALKQKFSNDSFQLRMFPYAYSWVSKNVLEFEVDGKNSKYVVQFDVATKQISSGIAIASEGRNQIISSDAKKVAWLSENNIKITHNNETISVTNDENKGIVNGSDYTHRQEFGINRGMWWSPKSDKLAFYRKDETMVTDYPLIDFGARIAATNNIKYPMAGEKSEEVTLVIFDINSKKSVTLQTGEPKEQYLTCVTWEPSGKFVYVGLLNRGQNHLKLNKYDASTGTLVKTLFEEKAPTYVEPLHDLTFLPNSDSQFLYRSENNGFEQLYLYNTDGKLLKNLGYKDVVVTSLLNFDSEVKNVFYIGTTNDGLDRQFFKVDLKSGKTTQLSSVSGMHSGSINSDGTLLFDQYSNVNTPNTILIKNLKNNSIANLVEAKDPYEGKTVLPKMELVKITAADGRTPLNGRLIYPANFDANKKYPVMVYVYGGPHAQLVQNEWLGGGSLFDYYMAQNGYVVFTVDNRGSDARGKDFEHVIHRNLGVNEMADQMKGIEFLKSKSFVDQEKIGVYGWSFGGFMTTSLMLNHNDVFKVGVAGGPVTNWKFYEIMYGERYMDTPQENENGYDNNNVVKKADQLKGRLLMIHGAQDPVVVQQHSMEFIQACIKAGKQVDYFLYPTHEHNVSGRDRIHLNQKIADYFDIHLK